MILLIEKMETVKETLVCKMVMIRIIVYHDHTFYTEISLAMHFISFE